MQAIEKISRLLISTGRPATILGKYILRALIGIGKFVVSSLIETSKFIFHVVSGFKIKIDFKIKVKKKKRKKFQFSWTYRYFVMGVLLIGASIFSWNFYQKILLKMPNINNIYNPPKMSTKILDREGNLLYSFYEDEKRSWVSIDKIPQSLIWSTISIEDKDFYKHHGVSILGMARAGIYNLRNQNDKPRGGSTITQQLVKNVYLSSEKSWERKVKEALIAITLENKLSKEEILERYFNQVAYGGEIYGVQEASKKYFGKNVWEITMAEASFLAGLPAAPSSYSPFGSEPELAFARQRHVIDEMVSEGYLNFEKGEEIKKEKVEIKEEEKGIEGAHFVFYIKDYLEKELGYRGIEGMGLVVKTSLDPKIQKMSEEIVKDEVDKVARLRIGNGSALVVNPKNGEILAMVGSKDYFAQDIDGKYNITQALRQPGSSIKPINYLLALEKGANLFDSIDDSPVSYQIKGQKAYSPQNYNGKYMGQVSLKTALASSLNVPSVKLLDKNGVEEMIELGEKMGISSWGEKNRFGLSLALGSGEVKMTEMARAYGVFANLGEKVELKPILEVRNYLGEVIYEGKEIKERVVDEENSFLINVALSDNQARSPIFGSNSKLVIPGKRVAVKTGTTNSLRDNWCVGWTPEIMVLAWVGNNDNSPMSWVASGVSGATPIWNRIMNELLKDRADVFWETPVGIKKENICGREEYVVAGREIKKNCSPPPEKEDQIAKREDN